MQFADLLALHNIPHKTQGKYCRPGWVQFQCPFCEGGADPDKLYCGFNLQYHYVNCWRCGKHPLQQTIAKLLKIPYQECKQLEQRLDRERVTPGTRVHIAAGVVRLPKGTGPLLAPHKQYLRSRRYDVADLERLWEIKGIGLATQLAWRILIPIHYQGQIASWTTRSLVDSGVRYISASPDQEAINHKELLYGQDYARDAVIVCEGPFDVWRIGPGAVATLGTGYSQSQVLALSKYPCRVICFDTEPAAQERARALCDSLSVFDGQTYNVTLDSKDPGSATQREIDKLRLQFL